MSLTKIISGYTQYNLWANERLSQWLASLESNLLYEETLSSFRSIDKTLQHISQSQNFWFAVITEAGTANLDLPTKSDRRADTAIHDLLTGSQQMLKTFTDYSEDELLKQIPSTDMVQSRYEFILHLVNHNSYHRGQIVTMSRYLGVVDNIPAMDYEVFLWTTVNHDRVF